MGQNGQAGNGCRSKFMHRPFIDALGRLGNRPASWLVYLGLAYQLIVSTLVFVFDSGFPVWLVVAGWGVLICVIAILALKESLRAKHDAHQQHRDWKFLQTRKTILQERLARNPELRTSCDTCLHQGAGNNSCRAHASSSERAFRFHRDDPDFHCLRWDPL